LMRSASGGGTPSALIVCRRIRPVGRLFSGMKIAW
jgi:hypothetical protein